MTPSTLLANIEKVLVGKPEVVKLVVTCLLAEGHVLLEDVPGTGKTMLARALAQSIDCAFSRIQGTSDLMPTDITGASIFDPRASEFNFRPGPVFANVLLMDELNRATPRAQSALLEAMAEQKVTYDGQTHTLPDLFFVIATMNPLDNVGTYTLPEAQLDRFMMKLSIGYLPRGSELDMVFAQLGKHPIHDLASVVSQADILAAREHVRKITLDRKVADYAAQLVGATREHPDLRLGVGPRGTLHLLRAAQAYAYLNGTGFVSPADIQALMLPVLAHRMRAKSGAGSGAEVQHILEKLVATIAVPR